jgi:hypothetical protein
MPSSSPASSTAQQYDQSTSALLFSHWWSNPLLPTTGVCETDIENELSLLRTILKEGSKHNNIIFRSHVGTRNGIVKSLEQPLTVVSNEIGFDDGSLHSLLYTADQGQIIHFNMHGENGSLGLEYPCRPFHENLGKMDRRETREFFACIRTQQAQQSSSSSGSESGGISSINSISSSSSNSRSGGVCPVPVKLVFVGACHSEAVGDAFVEIGVPHVISIKRYICTAMYMY